jgi:elongation factor Ts
MAAITASMVAELRAKTDAPMMECKKALTEAEGEHGQGRRTAARQAGQQGGQSCDPHHRRRRRDGIHEWHDRCHVGDQLRNRLRDQERQLPGAGPGRSRLVAKHNPADIAALGALPFSQDGFGPTLEDVRKGLIGKIGENMSFRRFKRFASGASKLAAYLHGTRIGVVVEYTVTKRLPRTWPCTWPP